MRLRDKILLVYAFLALPSLVFAFQANFLFYWVFAWLLPTVWIGIAVEYPLYVIPYYLCGIVIMVIAREKKWW